jgi:TolB-like protein/Flp pilus assembly protein TadD
VDALTAAVISDLSRISDATVISRGTTVTFKSKAFDTKAESKKMHVRYVLQGSVLRQDSRMRVDVQLIEGESGTHLWAEQYDRSREDLFAIQDEITGGLARALNLGLLRSDSRRPERLSPAALEAEDDALRGKSLLDGPAIAPASNREAIALLTRAIELDLDNAAAWIGLALAHSRAAVFGWSESRDGSVRASLEAANRAISVAPENAEAFEQLSVSERAAGRIAESIAAAEKCISFNRNLAGCYDSLAQGVLDQGRFEDAIQWTARALELSPRDARANAWHTTISYAYLCLGNDVKSIEEAGFAIAAREKYPSAYLYLAAAYANQGNIAEAKNALNEWKTMGAPSWSIAKQREGMFGSNKDPQLVSTVERRFFSGLRKAGMPEE